MGPLSGKEELENGSSPDLEFFFLEENCEIYILFPKAEQENKNLNPIRKQVTSAVKFRCSSIMLAV